jgi:hypothetical protein
MTRLGCLIFASALILPFTGCKKAKTDLPDVRDGRTAGGGLGFIDPGAPSPNPGQQPQPQPQPQPQQGPLPVGKTMDKLEHSGFPAVHTLAGSRDKLSQLGKLIIACANDGPVKSKADLGSVPAKSLLDPLGREYDIRWGIDLSKGNVPSTTLIAWEKTPDSTMNRRAVQADGAVVTLQEAEFKQRTNIK